MAKKKQLPVKKSAKPKSTKQQAAENKKKKAANKAGLKKNKKRSKFKMDQKYAQPINVEAKRYDQSLASSNDPLVSELGKSLEQTHDTAGYAPSDVIEKVVNAGNNFVLDRKASCKELEERVCDYTGIDEAFEMDK